MARDDTGTKRADLSTSLFANKKVKKLARLRRTTWEPIFTWWLSLVLEGMRVGERVNLEDGWPHGCNADPDDAFKALLEAGLIDGEGRLPQDTWDEWCAGPVANADRLRNLNPGGRPRRKRPAKKQDGTQEGTPDGTQEATQGPVASRSRSRSRSPATEQERTGDVVDDKDDEAATAYAAAQLREQMAQLPTIKGMKKR